MVVHINRLTDDGDYERIGTVDGGEVVDGGERIERLVESAETLRELGEQSARIPFDSDDSIEDVLIADKDGPYLVAESGS